MLALHSPYQGQAPNQFHQKDDIPRPRLEQSYSSSDFSYQNNNNTNGSGIYSHYHNYHPASRPHSPLSCSESPTLADDQSQHYNTSSFSTPYLSSEMMSIASRPSLCSRSASNASSSSRRSTDFATDVTTPYMLNSPPASPELVAANADMTSHHHHHHHQHHHQQRRSHPPSPKSPSFTGSASSSASSVAQRKLSSAGVQRQLGLDSLQWADLRVSTIP